MATKVLDSWALLAFFEDEPAAEEVEKLLVKAEAGTHKLLLSVVNWGEIYYSTMRKLSQEAAEQKVREIPGLTIELVPVDTDLHLVVRPRFTRPRRNCPTPMLSPPPSPRSAMLELVTGDLEFKEVEGEVKIGWLK